MRNLSAAKQREILIFDLKIKSPKHEGLFYYASKMVTLAKSRRFTLPGGKGEGPDRTRRILSPFFSSSSNKVEVE